MRIPEPLKILGSHCPNYKFPGRTILLTNNLNEQCNVMGLEMNLKRSKILFNNQVEDQDKSVKIDDTTLEILGEYLYLAEMIHNSASLVPKINRRTELA